MNSKVKAVSGFDTAQKDKNALSMAEEMMDEAPEGSYAVGATLATTEKPVDEDAASPGPPQLGTESATMTEEEIN